jgi:hypothetical protein
LYRALGAELQDLGSMVEFYRSDGFYSAAAINVRCGRSGAPVVALLLLCAHIPLRSAHARWLQWCCRGCAPALPCEVPSPWDMN